MSYIFEFLAETNTLNRDRDAYNYGLEHWHGHSYIHNKHQNHHVEKVEERQKMIEWTERELKEWKEMKMENCREKVLEFLR
jgi:virulence-associated protein VapD